MMSVLGVPIDGADPRASVLFGGSAPDPENLQVVTAYLATGIAALVGAGLRLRTTARGYPLGRFLLALVLAVVASTLVAFMRVPSLQPYVALSLPPWWMWVVVVGVLGAAALLEWGRQQVDQIPK
jgi:hypothetical protein